MAAGMRSSGSAAEGSRMGARQPDQMALHCHPHLVVGCLQQGVPGQLPPDRRQVCDGERDRVWSIASSAAVIFMHVVHCLLCCSSQFTACSAAAACTLAPFVPFPHGTHRYAHLPRRGLLSTLAALAVCRRLQLRAECTEL